MTVFASGSATGNSQWFPLMFIRKRTTFLDKS